MQLENSISALGMGSWSGAESDKESESSTKREETGTQIAQIARFFAKDYGLELLPADGNFWGVRLPQRISELGARYLQGDISAFDGLADDEFRPRVLLYDRAMLESGDENRTLARLRSEAGRIKYCNFKSYFEGQLLAKQNGSLPSTWLTLHNMIDRCRVDTLTANGDKQAHESLVTLFKDELDSARENIRSQPLTRQFAENIRFYWAYGRSMPELKSSEVLTRFERVKGSLLSCLKSTDSKSVFEAIRSEIWPQFVELEDIADSEERIRIVTRKISGSNLGQIVDENDLLSLWDLDEPQPDIGNLLSNPKARQSDELPADSNRGSIESKLAPEHAPSLFSPDLLTPAVVMPRQQEPKLFGLKKIFRRVWESLFGASNEVKRANSDTIEAQSMAGVDFEVPEVFRIPELGATTEASDRAGESDSIEAINSDVTSGTELISPPEHLPVDSDKTSPNSISTQAPSSVDRNESAPIEIKDQQAHRSTYVENAATGVLEEVLHPNLNSDSSAQTAKDKAEMPSSMGGIAEGIDSATVQETFKESDGEEVENGSSNQPMARPPFSKSEQLKSLALKLRQNLAKQEVAGRVARAIDRVHRQPATIDIDLSQLSPEVYQEVENQALDCDPDSSAVLSRSSRELLDRKQGKALQIELPKFLMMALQREEGVFQVDYRPQVDEDKVVGIRAEVQRFIIDYNDKSNKENARRIKISQEKIDASLNAENQARELHLNGFSKGEIELFEKFKSLESSMAGLILGFQRKFADLLPCEKQTEYEGAYLFGKKLNQKMAVRRFPFGDLRVLKRAHEVNGHHPKLEVVLLIDNTISMQDHNKMANALKVTVFWGRVLRNLNIPFSIKLFGERVTDIMLFGQDYDLRDLRIKHRLVTATTAQERHTNLSAGIESAFKDISARRKRNPEITGAIFVISDSGANHGRTGRELKRLIESVRAQFLITNFILTKKVDEVRESKSYFGKDNVVAPRKFEELPNEAGRVLAETIQLAKLRAV